MKLSPDVVRTIRLSMAIFYMSFAWQSNTQFIRQIHVFLKKTTVYDVSGDTSTHPQVHLKW